MVLLIVYLGMALAAAAAFWIWKWRLKQTEKPHQIAAWLLEPEELPREELKAVAVPPSLITGQHRLSATVWAPLQPVPEEDFRRQQGALMLSAAIALTQDQLPSGGLFPPAERRGEWIRGLRIDADNFRRKHPQLEMARVDGCEGPLVLDGLRRRAWFVGDIGLARHCTYIQTGTARAIGQRDRAQIEQLAPGAICYATCDITNRGAGPLTYLGAVCVQEQAAVSVTFLRARQELRDEGVETMLQPAPRAELNAAMEILQEPLEVAQIPQRGVMAVTPLEDDKDFSAPVQTMWKDRTERTSRLLRGRALTVVLAAAAILSGCGVWAVAAAFAALTLRIGQGDNLARPGSPSRLNLLLCALPALLPVVLPAFLAGGEFKVWQAAAGCALMAMTALSLYVFFDRPPLRTARWLARLWYLLPALLLGLGLLVSLFTSFLGSLFGLIFGALDGMLLVWCLRWRRK